MSISLSEVPFPHIVAHRGASGEAPENTLPAFKLALEQGAQEVEFDLWPAGDDEIVVCHDSTVDRTTNGTGAIKDLTWAYVSGLDAGVRQGPEWQGTRVPRLEEVFELVVGRAFMNIHVKDVGRDGLVIDRVRELAEAHAATDQIYIAGNRDVLVPARRKAPDIPRCCGGELFERARELDCARVQFLHSATTDDQIRAAVEQGLITNYFYSDDPIEAKRLLNVGIMALLTNVPGQMRALIEHEGDA